MEIKRIRIAETSNDPRTLRKMATSISTEVRVAVASNPNTPQDTLRVLAQDLKASVLTALARNPNTPDDIITDFGTKHMLPVREAAVTNAAAAMLAEQATSDRRHAVRYAAETRISSDRFSYDEFAMLSTHENVRVRAAVASNTSAPKEILAMMAHRQDEDVSVKVGLANNSNLEPALLRDLAQYITNHSVARNANVTTGILNALSQSADSVRARAIASHEKVTETALGALLAQHPGDPHIWHMISMHPEAAPELLARFANEKASTNTLHNIKNHANASAETKEKARLLLISRDSLATEEEIRELMNSGLASHTILVHIREFRGAYLDKRDHKRTDEELVSTYTTMRKRQRDIDEALAMGDKECSDGMIRRLLGEQASLVQRMLDRLGRVKPYNALAKYTSNQVLMAVREYENASERTKRDIDRILKAREFGAYTIERI